MTRRRSGTLSVVPGKGVQARIIRGQTTKSRFFRLSLFPGDETAAMNAAKAMGEAWLINTAAAMPEAVATRSMRKSNKSSDLIAGVSLSKYTDRRGAGQARYQVVYYVNDRRKAKSFMLGPVELLTKRDYAVGRKVAEAFRTTFLRATERQRRFEESMWRDWRERFGVEFKWRDGRTCLAHPDALRRAIEGA